MAIVLLKESRAARKLERGVTSWPVQKPKVLVSWHLKNTLIQFKSNKMLESLRLFSRT